MLSTVFRPTKLDNRHDPIVLGRIAKEMPKQITDLLVANNVDIYAGGVARRRDGRTLAVDEVAHSMYVSYEGVCYFVSEGVLKRLNSDNTTTILQTLSANLPLCYCPVNNELVVSNGVDIGWLNDGGFTVFASELGQFEDLMPAGQYVAFLNGCLYVACGSVLYVSKPYNAEVRDVRYSEFPFPGYIRMLASVEDGLWISTDRRVGFIEGQGTENFTYREITDKAPMDGAFSVVWYETQETVRREVRWASQEGLCVGMTNGNYANLSLDAVVLPKGATGKCLSYSKNGMRRILAIVHEPTTQNKYVPSVETVNTHSVY